MRENEAAPAVSVVVPVRNEAGNIAPLVAEIERALAGTAFEIVYVNDGSTDGTEAELAGLMAIAAVAAPDQARRVVRPVGGGADRRHACARAAGRRRSMATARTIRPSCRGCWPCLRTIRAIGLVAGQRVGRKDTGFKKFQSRIANGVRSAVLRDGTRDTGCGLKAFRRDLFLSLPYFDGLHRFLPALVRREGYEIGYVDVVDRQRGHGVSNYGMWDRLWVGILDLFGVWWLIRRKKRVPEATEIG